MRPKGFNLATIMEDEDTMDCGAPEREDIARKQYRRHRSLRTSRRTTSRMGSSQPGMGIAARRNRRWSW